MTRTLWIGLLLGVVACGGGSASAQTLDLKGNLFLPHFRQNQVLQVDKAGNLSVVAGTGEKGFSGDGGPATDARFSGVRAVAVDPAGHLYIVDMNNHRVRRVDAATGVISTIAGTGEPGYNGDDIPATQAQLNRPSAIAIDASGNVIVADGRNSRLRRVDAETGIITTIAGNGTRGLTGDGGLAIEAGMGNANGVALDKRGNIFFSDTSNDSIRRIDARTGIITTVAGNGVRDFGGDGGPAIRASLSHPNGVAVDGKGNIFVADGHNFRIRRVHPRTGVISTIAGNGTNGYTGDGGPATEATLDDLGAILLDQDGSLLFGNFDAVRRVDRRTRVITTVFRRESD